MDLVFKILYRFYRIFSWLRYQVTRRLTRGGWMVMIALVATGTMGIDTDHTVAYQAFAPLFFLFLFAIVFSWAFRVRFSANRLLPRFGTVGSPIRYTVVLRNLGRKVESELTLLETLVDPRPAYAEWKAVQLADERRVRSLRLDRRHRRHPFKPAELTHAEVPSVRPGDEVEVRAELTPLRRGALRFAGVSLARPDPFGLFRAFCQVNLRQGILVLPKRYPLPSMALPGTARYQEGGVALASSVGISDEFVSLRDYRRGDPLRHIHWRSWAKTGKPIVREFEDEFFVRHALVLDTFTNEPRSEAFEEAVSVAASFVCTIELQESLLDLLFVEAQAYCFTAGRALAHSDQMMEILASVHACGDKSFRTLEHLVLGHVSVVSSCICVLLAWDHQRREFVRKLQTLGVPLVVLVVTEPNTRPIEIGPLESSLEKFVVLEAGNIEAGLAKLAS